MTPFDWLEDNPLMKAEWRSASMEYGGQCVMTTGISMMPELCADSWGYLTQVLYTNCYCDILICSVSITSQLKITVLSLH